MLLTQETMLNESSSKLQSDGRPVSSSVGDGTLSADNMKSDQHPSATPCLTKCLLQRLCSLFRPSRCSTASKTHPMAKKMSASEPASIPQADKVSSHSTTAQHDGPKNDGAKAGTALARPRQYKPQSRGSTLRADKVQAPITASIPKAERVNLTGTMVLSGDWLNFLFLWRFCMLRSIFRGRHAIVFAENCREM